MKPVTNYVTTYRRLFQGILDGQGSRVRAIRRWPSGWPTTRRSRARAYREWITWMYKENRLVSGRMRLRGRRVDLSRDRTEPAGRHRRGRPHRPARTGTVPLLSLVAQRGRDAPGSPGRAHRPDGGIEGQARNLARARRLARRALGSLRQRERDDMATTTTAPSDGDASTAPACTDASRSSPAAPAGSAPRSRAASPSRARRSPPATAATRRTPTSFVDDARQGRADRLDPPGQRRLGRRLPPNASTR